MDRPFAAGSGGLGFSGDGRRRVRELYGAFRRSQNDADRDTADLVAGLGVLTGLDIEFDDAEGRLLLAGLGGDEDAIYAVPSRSAGSPTRYCRTVEDRSLRLGRTGFSWFMSRRRPGCLRFVGSSVTRSRPSTSSSPV
jgi:hypothetical protein